MPPQHFSITAIQIIQNGKISDAVVYIKYNNWSNDYLFSFHTYGEEFADWIVVTSGFSACAKAIHVLDVHYIILSCL